MTVTAIDPAALTYDDRGLLPVVVQDVVSGAVLMLAYANREAVERTLATGEAHFYSRSRQELWRKGATSGNTLAVSKCFRTVTGTPSWCGRFPPVRPATTTRGAASSRTPPSSNSAGWRVCSLSGRKQGRRRATPPRLLDQGVDRIARKVAEEAGETVIAGVRADAEPESAERRADLAAEVADLAYHLLVLLQATGVGIADVAAELGRRHQQAGGTQP